MDYVYYHWSKHPFIRGAYSSPTVHAQGMRHVLATLCKTACSLLVKLPMSRPVLAFTRPWKLEQELLMKFVELLNAFRRSSNRRGPKWDVFGFINLFWIIKFLDQKTKLIWVNVSRWTSQYRWVWITHKTGKFHRPFPSHKIILLALFGPFTDQDDTFLDPFIYPKPEKRYPCRVEPPRIGHYRDYPPPPSTTQSTVKSLFIPQITSHYRLLFLLWTQWHNR